MFNCYELFFRRILTEVASQGFSRFDRKRGTHFDDIGNRTAARSGGDAAGAAWRTATSTHNALNQITGRTRPGYLDVLGTASNAATVTVNHQPAARQGGYFRVELPVDNTAGPALLQVTNVAVLNRPGQPDLISGSQ